MHWILIDIRERERERERELHDQNAFVPCSGIRALNRDSRLIKVACTQRINPDIWLASNLLAADIRSDKIGAQFRYHSWEQLNNFPCKHHTMSDLGLQSAAFKIEWCCGRIWKPEVDWPNLPVCCSKLVRLSLRFLSHSTRRRSTRISDHRSVYWNKPATRSTDSH